MSASLDSGVYPYHSSSEHSSSEGLLDNMASGVLDAPIPTIEKDDINDSAIIPPNADLVTERGNAISTDGVVFASNDSESIFDGDIFKTLTFASTTGKSTRRQNKNVDMSSTRMRHGRQRKSARLCESWIGVCVCGLAPCSSVSR